MNMFRSAKELALIVSFFATFILSGCVNDSVKKSDAPAGGNGAAVNRLLANDFTAPAFPSKTTATVELSYTSLDGELASTCSVFSYTNLNEVQSCACSGGVCTVQVTAPPKSFEVGGFSFYITANGKTSTTGRASVPVAAALPGSNIAPTISSVSNQTTTEGLAISSLPVVIGDTDSNITCANITSASSNTTLIPNSNVVIGGAYPNCNVSVTPAGILTGTSTITLTVTDNGDPVPVLTANSVFTVTVTAFNDPPTISSIVAQTTLEDTAKSGIAFTIADVDSTLNCSNVTGTSSNTSLVSNSNIVIGGTAPNCTVTATPTANASGVARITLTVTDNGTPLPAKTASTAFDLTVSPVNDVPTVSSVLAQSTTEESVKNIAFTISDIDSTVNCSNVVGTSSNTGIVTNANIVITGTAPNCSAAITPEHNMNGTLSITLTLTDTGTPMPGAVATRTFSLTVDPVNDVPTISSIISQTTNEDTASSAIAFTISDIDSTISCSNVVGTSSNTTSVPNANIVITGTAPNCTAVISPALNQVASSSITLTLTDNGTPFPAQTATSAFNFFINPINDAPSIAAISAQSTYEDTTSSPIPFVVTEVDSNITCSNITAVSSNTALVPNVNLTIGGTYPNCTVTATPAANQNGTTTITLTVTDTGTPTPVLTGTRAFTLNVLAVPDITGTLTVASNLSGVASSYTGNSYARILKFTGLTVDEAVTDLEVCLGTSAGGCDVATWVQGVGYTSGGTAPSVTLGGQYRLTSGSGGAQVFTLTKSCGAVTNYYYSVRVTNSTGVLSNIVSTPAWSFWEPTCLGVGTLTQWLDASESSTITLATGVSSWTDKSGNARTVTQATAGKQPVYSATALGGVNPGLTFNGTSSSLSRTSFVYAQGSASVFAVMRANAAAGKYLFSEGRTATTNNIYAPMMSSATNTLTGIITNNALTNELNQPASSSLYQNATSRFVMSTDSGTSFLTYSNGTVQSQAATAYTRAANTINTYRLGASVKAGVEANWYSGVLSEFMVTTGVVSLANRQKLEGYSAHKWGLQGSLPGGHPNLTIPP